MLNETDQTTRYLIKSGKNTFEATMHRIFNKRPNIYDIQKVKKSSRKIIRKKSK